MIRLQLNLNKLKSNKLTKLFKTPQLLLKKMMLHKKKVVKWILSLKLPFKHKKMVIIYCKIKNHYQNKLPR
jgi:hypothetical protein